MSEADAVTATRVLIREPRESEFAACRMLLPEACAHPTGRVFRLAFDSVGLSILGALSYIDDSQAINAVRLHVVKGRRRMGVGSRLLAYALEEAGRLGRDRVLVDADVKNELDAEPFLLARGFQPIARVTSVQGDLQQLAPKFALVRDRLVGADELPSGARIMSIREAPLDQVLELCATHIAREPMLAGMLRTFQPEQYPESLVLMVADQVIGFILAQVSTGILHAPAWVVAPEYQGKHLGTRLIVALANRARGTYRHVQFDFPESAAPTGKLASQLGCEVVRINVRFERTLRT